MTFNAAATDGLLLTLRNENLTLELAPSAGGSIARFYSDTNGTRQHWLRPATVDAILHRDAEGMASFPLVPFCNRIRNGRAEFDSRQIHMPSNRGTSPHTIHGIGWQRPWSVVEQDASSALLAYEYEGGDWPYPFRALQRYQLQNRGLTVSMEVTNCGTEPMPLGIGHHPYLPNRSSARLTVAVDAMWGGDAEVMPTNLQWPPLIAQLRDGVQLSGVEQDNNFIGWNHTATVDWPASNEQFRACGLRLKAESPLDYFVLYSPTEHDFFCIEPVSNCTDWLNLNSYSKDQIGGSVVAPGETCTVMFSLTPYWKE